MRRSAQDRKRQSKEDERIRLSPFNVARSRKTRGANRCDQMRKRAPAWSAFDIRMMFQGYLERGWVAEEGDLKTLTKLLGHAPRSYEEFARETVLEWQNNKSLHLSPAA